MSIQVLCSFKKLGYLFSCYWVVWISYILRILISYEKHGLQIFLSFWVFLFTLFIASCAEAFSLMQFHLSIFAFVSHAFVAISKKSLPKPISKRFFSVFFQDFMVLSPTFEVIFVYGVIWFQFQYFVLKFSQNHYKETVFP